MQDSIELLDLNELQGDNFFWFHFQMTKLISRALAVLGMQRQQAKNGSLDHGAIQFI